MGEEQFERLERQEARDGRFLEKATGVAIVGLSIGAGLGLLGTLEPSASPTEPNNLMNYGLVIMRATAVAYYPVAC